MRLEFWDSWGRKTRLEIDAIESIRAAKKLILKEIPRKQIVSIYAKGSFIRREMNKNSDVDTITILKKSSFLKKLKKLEIEYGNKYKPQIQFSGYSLWELKCNKRTKSGVRSRASPSRTVQHLKYFKLLYGKKLREEDFNQGPTGGHLKGMLFAFKHIFLPGYVENKFKFSEIVKQVFWLVENEEIRKERNPPHNWGELARSIKDKNHIIYDALEFRRNPTKDEKKRIVFIAKLKSHLIKLEEMANGNK